MAITQNRVVNGNDNGDDGLEPGCCCACFSFSKFKRAKVKRMEIKEDADVNTEHAAFFEKFAKPLETGHYVTVTGVVRPACLRFSIDFVCIPTNENVAFHFNPRLEQRYVVRNCRVNGSWGDEETTSLVDFSFEPEKKFTVNFLVTDDEFLVMVNGRHFCGFAHRLNTKQITGLEVNGDIDVKGVSVEQVKSYPVDNENILRKVEFDQEYNPNDIQVKDIPFTAVLPQGFKHGWQLEIYAKVKILPHSFYVNLQDGAQYWPHPNIPLHLNPRFSTAVGAYSFVRNSWVSNAWSQEERAPTFPFTPGYSFCMVIRTEADGFSVWVDGKLTGEFPYRTPDADKSITCVYIQGDIHLNHVTMRRKIKDMYFTNPLESIDVL